MQHMLKAKMVEVGDVIVVKAIEDKTAVFAGAYQSHLAQMAHVMGDGGFADADHFSQRADVHFAFRQGGDDAEAAGVAERAE